MVNTGRSGGCGLCRKRKVKCDEGKPGCLRCSKIGKECPGYPVDVLFRIKTYQRPGNHSPNTAQPKYNIDQSVLAASAINASSSPEGSHHDDEIRPGVSPPLVISGRRQGSEFSQDDIECYDAQCSSIKHVLSYDRDHQSICHFFQTMVFSTINNYNITYAQFLPMIYLEAKPASCLRLALRAASNINLANRVAQDPSWNAQAAIDYGMAIRAIHEAFQDPAERLSDQTLVAVWLLGVYENLLLFSPYTQSQKSIRSNNRDWKHWLAHISGVQALLQLRGIDQFSTPRGRQIFTLLHAAIQLTCVVHGVEEGSDFSKIMDRLYSIEQLASVASSKVVAFYRQVTRIRSRMKRIISWGAITSRQSNDIEEFLRVGQNLDLEMEDWETEYGEKVDLLPSTTPGLSNLSSHDQPFAMFTYYTFWGFYQYMRFQTTRMMLNDALIAVLRARLTAENAAVSISSPRAYTTIQIARRKAIIQMAATNIIGSVAHGLGDIKFPGRRRVPPRSHNDDDCEEVLGTKAIGGVNIVASLQLFQPLELITSLEDSSQDQKYNARLAMRRVEEEFRFRL